MINKCVCLYVYVMPVNLSTRSLERTDERIVPSRQEGRFIGTDSDAYEAHKDRCMLWNCEAKMCIIILINKVKLMFERVYINKMA